jgi:glyoxylase-like metal-dependent hydrolase (beta-lactamase superfamily II)
MTPLVEPFFDVNTGTFSYVVYNLTGNSCAVVDPLRDYDGSSARTGHVMADQIIEFITRKGLQLQWLLETHIHADHLSASTYLKGQLGGKIATSAAVRHVGEQFYPIFNGADATFDPHLHFDHLFEPDEEFYIGDMRTTAMHVPGHTQADMAFYVENTIIFVGDTLFAPDVGTARCDFPGGSARMLWKSIQRILRLPLSTRMYLCHDYPPESRGPCCEFSVGLQKTSNVHLSSYQSESEFARFRNERDKALRLPDLLLPSLQANLRAGALPAADSNGIAYMTVPLNTF